MLRSQQNSSRSPALLTKPRSPPVVYHPPAPTTGFGQLIKEGIGFGAGQAIAHRAVNAILGPAATTTTVVQQSTDPKSPCHSERTTFETCMKIKTQDDHCNNEHLAYTQCLDLTQKSQ
jgi:hypothetical protein